VWDAVCDVLTRIPTQRNADCAAVVMNLEDCNS